MPVKLSTTIKNLESLESPVNSKLILEFHNYLRLSNTSGRYQNQNIRALVNFSQFFCPTMGFYHLSKNDDILAFLSTQMICKETGPDGKWMRTWNDYLQGVKYCELYQGKRI